MCGRPKWGPTKYLITSYEDKTMIIHRPTYDNEFFYWKFTSCRIKDANVNCFIRSLMTLTKILICHFCTCRIFGASHVEYMPIAHCTYMYSIEGRCFRLGLGYHDSTRTSWQWKNATMDDCCCIIIYVTDLQTSTNATVTNANFCQVHTLHTGTENLLTCTCGGMKYDASLYHSHLTTTSQS